MLGGDLFTRQTLGEQRNQAPVLVVLHFLELLPVELPGRLGGTIFLVAVHALADGHAFIGLAVYQNS